jgi:hypothetical protein
MQLTFSQGAAQLHAAETSLAMQLSKSGCPPGHLLHSGQCVSVETGQVVEGFGGGSLEDVFAGGGGAAAVEGFGGGFDDGLAVEGSAEAGVVDALGLGLGDGGGGAGPMGEGRRNTY